ncbi:MAG: septum formation protein Maf [Deltaproteobacteria bacterium]|nr:septum formation protein Maf [Deltaproteobacteria bacterium]MBI3295452.1 septum formation protein Maf [Deltaproteobacteria bacterium]
MKLVNSKENPPLPQIILASQSPRRRQILESLGLSFASFSPDVEEVNPTAHNIDDLIQENAYRKALKVSQTVTRSTDIVVAADTLVLVDGVVVTKPESPEDGRFILKTFSGRAQTVVSGLVLFSHYYGIRKSTVKTEILFHDLNDQQIDEYLLTKEPYDKAGAYAVQGLGALFIKKMEGSYTNAMGFPLEQFLRELNALTQIPLYRFFQ